MRPNSLAISADYANSKIEIEPDSRLHRLVAMLVDTWYDDLTDDRISELEQKVAEFRWMDSTGKRLDR